MARAHGFDLCRFTQPKIEHKFLTQYDAWLEAGFYADMSWMAEAGRAERRKQPELMLPGVRTVITVAMRYTPPGYLPEQAQAAGSHGVISSYAWGDDYHDIMKKRLKALARDVDGMLGQHDQRVYVDTAPVLENALAETSGLGWQGKHSLTLNRQIGSWFFLGELFTTAEIEPDAPASGHCGTCSACLDACPTKAIVGPFIVNARRCISYLTIEQRGWIDRALRPLMGNRIYGCDDCQLVCPWNRHVEAPVPDLLNPRRENILPELASLLALDDAAFRHRFAKSPIKRIGRAALIRNACIAAGNSGDAAFAPILLQLLQDSSAVVRGHAAWALGRLEPQPAQRNRWLQALTEAACREDDAVSHEEISLTIQKIKEK